MNIKEYIVIQDKDSHPKLKVKHKYEWNGTDFSEYDNIVDMLNKCFNMNILAEEYMYIVSFDAMLNLKGVFQLAHGSTLNVKVRKRELIIFLLLSGADQFVIAHNHTTNSLEPSFDDKMFTLTLEGAAQTFNITLLEHILICKDDYTLIKDYMIEKGEYLCKVE